MIETEAVKLIERALVTERVIALIRDFLLADQLFLGAGQLFARQAVTCEFLNLIEQRRFHWLDLLRIGPEIESEKPGHQSLHLTGADVVRQPHLFTDADEKPRAQIAARFIDEFERIVIRTEHVDAAISDHDHALRFLLLALDICYLPQRRRRMSVR